jgi:hypothetical protein
MARRREHREKNRNLKAQVASGSTSTKGREGGKEKRRGHRAESIGKGQKNTWPRAEI